MLTSTVSLLCAEEECSFVFYVIWLRNKYNSLLFDCCVFYFSKYDHAQIQTWPCHEYKYGCCGINWLLCVMCRVYGRSTNTMRPGHKYEYGRGPILWLLCWLPCVQPGMNTNTAVAFFLIVVLIVECPFSNRLTRSPPRFDCCVILYSSLVLSKGPRQV